MATQPTTATPTISCFHLPAAEYNRRTDVADERADAMSEKYGKPAERYGREIIWHLAFPAEFVAQFGSMPLHEIGVWLRDYCASSYNDGQALDLADYGYLADVLREGLADNPKPLAALRLARALAWVEQAGAALLPKPAASGPTAAPPQW